MRIPMAMAIALLCACSSASVSAPPAAPVDWHAFDVHRVVDAGPLGTTAKERLAVETYAAAMRSPTFMQLSASLDDSARFIFPGMSDARGREAVVRSHEVLFGAFDSRAFSIGRGWRTESWHALEWTMTGRQAKDWMGVGATNKPVAVKGLTLLRTKDDGHITEIHVYFDVALVKLQLGVKPEALLPGRPVRGQHLHDLANLAVPPASPAQAGAPQVFEQAGSADEQLNVAAVRSTLDAFEGTSDSAYVATMTDDVDVFALERAEPMHGKSSASEYFTAMHKAIGQLDTTIEDISGIAEYVVVEYSISGEQIGAIGWIPPQRDVVVRLHVADVIEMRGGKIARVWRYDNPTEIALPL